MDSKRPDVRMDDEPDEEGVVTGREGDDRESLVGKLRRLLGR